MPVSAPHLRPQSVDLLTNIELFARLRKTNAEGCLYEDLKNLVQWLASEVRHISRPLAQWAQPMPYFGEDYSCIDIEPDDSWRVNGKSAVSLYFGVHPEGAYDDDFAPDVGVNVDLEWEHGSELCDRLVPHRPSGFVSTYSTGKRQPGLPFWKPLPLRAFQKAHGFDLDALVREIGTAFETLAGLRPVIDGFIAEHRDREGIAPALRKALILDTETWGNSGPNGSEIVEVGLILVAYDSKSGECVGILDSYEGLRDPGNSGANPSDKITRAMVKGKTLDKRRIEGLISQADIIIAHNAFGFDKPRFQRLFPSSASHEWVCSYQGLAWQKFGCEGNLPGLCEHYGVKNRNSHRALPDAEALLALLTRKHGAVSFFAELVGPTLRQKKKSAAPSRC